MSNSPMKVIDGSPIVRGENLVLEITYIAQSVEGVNSKFRQLIMRTEKMALNVFEIIDFRMISGLVGEALVTVMSDNHPGLEKNPNIDGYPDLLDASKREYRQDIESWKASNLKVFVKYPHGGIEIKNTFGTKKAQTNLKSCQSRTGKINGKLDWKAHHRYTNNLLALLSDYIDGCPQIVAVMYSDSLTESDWREKQDPKENSTMTSFCVIDRSGWEKLKSGIKLCRDDRQYLSFFGL